MRPTPFHRSIRPRSARRGRSGFTLLELVAVIGIIALMSVLVVAGFSGIMRAVSATSGTDSLRRAINLARQQACVDGVDTFVWVTDIDKYAVVRKVGTISSLPAGTTRTPPYDTEGTARSDAKWIVDEYADIDLSGLKFAGEDNDISKIFVAKSAGKRAVQAFDMKEKKMADVKYPPWFSRDDDYWVFGIDKGASGFKAGADYGWLVFPEQSLPSGYIFKDSYDASGRFKEGFDKKVHFKSDGTVDSEATFELVEVASGKTHKVVVDGEGKITVEIENEDQNQGS